MRIAGSTRFALRFPRARSCSNPERDASLESFGKARIVTDENDCAARRCARLEEQLHEGLSKRLVEGGRGFVRHHERRRAEQRSNGRDSLLLADRQGSRAAIPQLAPKPCALEQPTCR